MPRLPPTVTLDRLHAARVCGGAWVYHLVGATADHAFSDFLHIYPTKPAGWSDEHFTFAKEQSYEAFVGSWVDLENGINEEAQAIWADVNCRVEYPSADDTSIVTIYQRACHESGYRRYIDTIYTRWEMFATHAGNFWTGTTRDVWFTDSTSFYESTWVSAIEDGARAWSASPMPYELRP